MSALRKFEGHEVIGTKAKIIRTGDGLSQALEVAPEEHKIGDKVYVVIETTVAAITFTPVQDAPRSFNRVETLRAGTATIVEHELVKDVLEGQRLAIEEAQGVTHLEFGE